MVDEIVTRQELIDAKRDAQDLGRAVNEKVIVSPRYGEDFKSLPMITEEFQDAINTIVVNDGVPALAVYDASGKSQQEINGVLVKVISYPSEISDFKPNVGDIFYISEKEAHFKTENGVADNILSFPAGVDKRAKLIHNGEIHYKNIGSTAANLMYSVNTDLSIKKVTGDELIVDSIIQFSRGDFELEFDKVTYPTTISGENNPLSALIECKGTVLNESLDSYILVAELPEFSEYFPVSNITKFSVGDWIIVSNSTSPQKINYMVQVLELAVDKIKVDYRLGWTLSAGDTLNFKKVSPIQDVTLKANSLDYQPTDIRQTARAGCLFQYASNCHLQIKNEVKNTYWPVLAGRHTSRCSITNTELQNPQETQGGGDGYLVQWQYSLYCKTEDCVTFADRHLNDFTMCAYGSVVNCRSINSEDGGFVTHGHYEHDLYYANNVGTLSFANSGVIFGERCKRVLVSKHNGNRLIAKAGVVDLTLNDVAISDYAEINNDGFVSNGLTVLNGITFTSFLPKLSKRQTIASGGALTMNVNRAIVNAIATGSIVFSKVVINKFQNQTANGYVDVVFDQCDISADYNANINFLNLKSLKFIGGQCTNFGIRFTDNRDQKIQVLKTEFSGKNSADAYIDNRKTGGVAEMTIDMISTTDVAYHYSVTQSAGRCQLDVIGGKYVGGSVRYQQATADLTGSYLYIRGTTEETVTRTLPTASAKVKLGDCLILA